MSQDYRPFTAVIKTAESGLKAKYNLAESPTKPAASPTKSPKSKANKDRFGSIFGGSIYAHEAASTSPKESDADATRSSPPKATLIQGWHAERHPKWGVQTQAAVDTRPPITSVVVEPPPQEDAAASKPSPPKATLLQGFHAARHPKWGVQAAQTATTSQPIFPSGAGNTKDGNACRAQAARHADPGLCGFEAPEIRRVPCRGRGGGGRRERPGWRVGLVVKGQGEKM